MNILLVGSGGREHALAWKIAQSPLLTRLVIAPGNPGMVAQGELRAVKATDVPALVALAQEIAADLVVIGPESAVEAGLADALAMVGIPCFGPSAAAGRLETSKAFAKDFATRHGLPTAAYGVFEQATPAKAFLDRFKPPYVIKADGLASGKGVAVVETRADAEAAIDERLGGAFGAAGARVVIEEFLEGEIASQFALCDGRTSRAVRRRPGPQARLRRREGPQHRRHGDLRSRAGAERRRRRAGAHAADRARVRRHRRRGRAVPGRDLLRDDGHGRGAEAGRVQRPLRRSRMPGADAAPGRATSCPTSWPPRRAIWPSMPPPTWRDEAAICVVLASKGYPGAALEPDALIRGARERARRGRRGVPRRQPACREDGALVTAGGRALNVCATGPTLQVARDRAYAAIEADRLARRLLPPRHRLARAWPLRLGALSSHSVRCWHNNLNI